MYRAAHYFQPDLRLPTSGVMHREKVTFYMVMHPSVLLEVSTKQ